MCRMSTYSIVTDDEYYSSSSDDYLPRCKVVSNEPIEWEIFANKYTNKKIEKRDIDIFIVDINNTLRFVDSGCNFTILRRNNRTWEDTNIRTLSSSFRVHLNSSKRFHSIESLIPMFRPRLNIYKSMTFLPCKQTDRSIFNIFEKYVADKPINDSIDYIKQVSLFEYHIKNVWAQGKPDEVKEWLLQRLYHTIQRPYDKVSTAIILSGKQGTGKGIILNWIINKIIGNEYAVEVAGLRKVTGETNSIIANKILLVIDEASNTTTGTYNENFDILKHIISEENVTIKKLYKDPYTVPNYINFIICTNHSNSIQIEQTDRRYFVTEVGDDVITNTNYKNKLIELIKDENFPSYFLKHVMNYNITMNMNTTPITEEKQDMILLNAPNHIKFLRYLNESNDTDTLTATELYTTYKNWSVDNGERNIQSSTKFGTNIKKLIDKKRTNKGWVYDISTLKT